MARKPPGPRPKKSGPVRDWHLWNAVGSTVDPLLRRKSTDPKALLEALEKAAEEPDAGKPRDTSPRFARPPLPSAQPMIAASKIPASEKSIEPNLKRRLSRGHEPIGYLQLEQKGVLRSMVPVWLNAKELAPMVAGIDPAHQSHGGGGALYVRLKRKREK